MTEGPIGRRGGLWRRAAVCVAIASLLCAATGCANAYVRPKTTPLSPVAAKAAATGELRDVVLVGNNWEGTAIAFDPVTFERLMSIDIVPDWNERIAEIRSSPVRIAAFTAIRKLAGEDHNQLVDDLFTSQDGRLLFASRPSFADVVAINLETRQIVWRRPVEGTRADHAALSPDGRTLLVSASTAGRSMRSIRQPERSSAASSRVTNRTKATTPPMAPASITPVSAACSCR